MKSNKVIFENQFADYLRFLLEKYAAQNDGIHSVVNEFILIPDAEWDGTNVGIIHNNSRALTKALSTAQFHCNVLGMHFDASGKPVFRFHIVFNLDIPNVWYIDEMEIAMFHDRHHVNSTLICDKAGAKKIRPLASDAHWETLTKAIGKHLSIDRLKGY